MTTPLAEKLYLAQHEVLFDGTPYAVFNPHNKPLDELPFIFGFNNGGSPGWYHACLIAEDGMGLGGHCCSHEGCMRHDLGIYEGTRPDRHESFRKHYPDGYRMTFIPMDKVKTCEPLLRAYKLNQEIAAKEAAKEKGE
jgi:hypothetical protein